MDRNLTIWMIAVGFALWPTDSGRAQTPMPGPTSSAGKGGEGSAAGSPARTRDVVTLPSPLNQAVIGGSGKYLVAFLPGLRQVAVLDVAAKKIAKFLPVDGDDVLVAAGATKFVVLDCTNRTIARYSFDSFERELASPSAPYKSLAMGSSSQGPLVAVGPDVAVLDLATLWPKDVKAKINLTAAYTGETVMAAANGAVFGCWHADRSPSGMALLEIVDDQIRHSLDQGAAGPVVPGPDGAVIYTSGGRYGTNGKPLDTIGRSHTTNMLLPAATGPYYVSFNAGRISGKRGSDASRLVIHCQNDPDLKVTATDVVLPVPLKVGRSAQAGRRGLEHHLFLLPIVDSLVTVPLTRDQFVIQHFNVREELEKSDTDYFFVSSLPPSHIRPGEKLSYVIEVASKRTELTYLLEVAPPGMSVSPQGVVTWELPADQVVNNVSAVVKIADSSGREIRHQIKLNASPSSSLRPAPPALASAPPPVSNAAAGTPAAQLTPPGVPAAQAVPKTTAGTRPLAPSRENEWNWSGSAAICVPGEKGGIAGILVDNTLYFIDADGVPVVPGVILPCRYVFLAARAQRLVGVAKDPTRVDTLDRQGTPIGSIEIGIDPPTGFALHPSQPVCYVARDRGQFHGQFVAVDEEAGHVTAGDGEPGQQLAVDPSGKFLVASLSHKFHVADELVVLGGGWQAHPPSGAGPRPPAPPPQPGGSSRPGVPQAPSGVQLGIRETHAQLSLALIYELEDPLRPGRHSAVPLPGAQIGQLRISFDGRRVTSLALGHNPVELGAVDPLNRNTPPAKYSVTGGATNPNSRADLAHHPLLPITVVAGASHVTFFDTNSGRSIVPKADVGNPAASGKHVERVMFSTDGKQLLVVTAGVGFEHWLTRVKLAFTNDERAAMDQRAAAPASPFAKGTAAFAALTALGGGVPAQMSTADIAANYSDAVAIVRYGSSTGTGFVVGESGLVLTCAHCVSVLENVEVVYHPAGQVNDKKVVRATVVGRDVKRDLALLKIDVDQPLHAVVLAPPVEVRNGEDVTIIANPGLGTEVLDNTVTTGVISNAKRTIEGLDFVQSSAAVNPGSSGGPMFDRQGRVVGVVVLKAIIDGVGFAVPAPATTQFLLKATRRDGQDGQLVRKWVDKSLTREFEGRLMGIDKGTVTLVSGAGGQSKTRPFTIFSAGDQKFLEMLAADKEK